MGSGLSAGRRERRKGQPTALPRLERDDAYGSASTYICVGPRFREQIPCTLASLMASTLEPPAAGPDPHHEASPPARSHPADRAEFQCFWRGERRRGSAHHPPAAPLAVLPAGADRTEFQVLRGRGERERQRLTHLPHCVLPASAAITHLGYSLRCPRRQQLHPGHQKARGG